MTAIFQHKEKHYKNTHHTIMTGQGWKTGCYTSHNHDWPRMEKGMLFFVSLIIPVQCAYVISRKL